MCNQYCTVGDNSYYKATIDTLLINHNYSEPGKKVVWRHLVCFWFFRYALSYLIANLFTG